MSYRLKHSKTEGGSGGRRGHSNMCHWDKTEIVKDESKKARRRADSIEAINGLQSWLVDKGTTDAKMHKEF